MLLACIRAEIFVLLLHGQLLLGRRAEEHDLGKVTCEEKLALGRMCSLFLRMDNESTVMDFSGTTTVYDVRKYVDEWRESKGQTGPFPRWVLTFKTFDRASSLTIDGDNQTLISLGLGHISANIVVGQITVNEPRMLGGIMYGAEVVNPEDYDFVVLIFHTGGGGNALGTGTISGKYVLTAAHVLANKKPENFRVVLAHRHFTETALGVSEIILFPGNGAQSDPDLAIAVLIGDGYSPRTKVHFMGDTLESLYQDPPACYLAGFGMTENEKRRGPSPDRNLVVGKFKVSDGCVPRTQKEHFGCATSRESPTAACIGDSGGPWFITEGDEHFIFGVHHGATGCKANRQNMGAVAEFTKLAETANFWGQYIDVTLESTFHQMRSPDHVTTYINDNFD